MDILNGQPIENQSKEVQEWFNTEILPKINFEKGANKTYSELDSYGRPHIWEIDKITVRAEYFTEDENYTFNRFILNGTI